MHYKLIDGSFFVLRFRDANTTTIPNEPLNIDWQDYKDWLALGNIPEPADVPPEPIIPDWEGFNVAFLSDPDWQAVSAQLPAQILMGVAASAATANISALQSAYNIAKGVIAQAEQVIPEATLEGWQAIADAHNIPLTF